MLLLIAIFWKSFRRLTAMKAGGGDVASANDDKSGQGPKNKE
jgi:hypothetical protein